MPAAARGNGVDRVLSRTGTGKNCAFPMTTSTGSASTDVFIQNGGGIRQSDIVGTHPAAGCTFPDLSPLTKFSSKVFINGRGAGRIGDEYTSDNIIISGSTSVFFG